MRQLAPSPPGNPGTGMADVSIVEHDDVTGNQLISAGQPPLPVGTTFDVKHLPASEVMIAPTEDNRDTFTPYLAHVGFVDRTGVHRADDPYADLTCAQLNGAYDWGAMLGDGVIGPVSYTSPLTGDAVTLTGTSVCLDLRLAY